MMSRAEKRPVLSRLTDWLTLDDPRQTHLHWLGVLLVCTSVLLPRLLPCVDYPQHLALTDVARRLADPAAPEHEQFQLNYFTYNGLFHVTTAALARVLPLEIAGRVMVMASLLFLAAGIVALLRVLKRPVVYASLFTPVLFSFSVGWGFINYALGISVAVWALVFVASALERASVAKVLAIAAIGLCCAMTHVLAMLLLCLLALSLAPEVAWRSTRAHAEARGKTAALGLLFARICGALGPLLVGCAYCIAVFREQYAWAPAMYKDPTLEGHNPPFWTKIRDFCSFTTGLHTDESDQLFVLAAIVIFGWAVRLAYVRRKRGAGDARAQEPTPGAREIGAPLILPGVAIVITYFAMPMVLVGTHLILPRIAQLVILGGILAMPQLPAASAISPRRIAILGVLAGLNLFAHVAFFAVEVRDASLVIDEAPPGRRATAVLYEPSTFSFRSAVLVHLAAYYAARKHGDWSFSFARYLSVPVRYKDGHAPGWPSRGWEFSPGNYNPRSKYARTFDLVFVKAPSVWFSDSLGEAELRRRVFGPDADSVTTLAHHGVYWAFDTKGLPSDGTW